MDSDGDDAVCGVFRLHTLRRSRTRVPSYIIAGWYFETFRDWRQGTKELKRAERKECLDNSTAQLPDHCQIFPERAVP